MPLKELYELVRKEDVCLWIGSGFSLYAGFPSSTELKKLLYESLGADKQNQLDLEKPLPDFTLDVATMAGRPWLMDIVQEHFRIPPTSTYFHDLLSRVAHFKTIITTNYDHLIENAYTKRAVVVSSSNQVGNIVSKLTKIYKIHGDIDDRSGMVLTRDDYAALYNRNFKDPFWASIIHEMSTKHVIFLGYGYEDENVWSDFNHIDKHLQKNGKRRFLISRDLSELKQKRLSQLNIEYIKASLEDFVPALLEEIKINLSKDFAKGFVSTEVVKEFIGAFDMNYQIHSSGDTSQLLSLSRKSGPTSYKFSFSSMDMEFKEAFERFNRYESLELTVTSEQLTKFSFNTEGFELLDLEDLGSFGLTHIPKEHGICTVGFPDSELEMEDFSYEVHIMANKAIVKGIWRGFTFLVTGSLDPGSASLNFKFTEPSSAKSISDYLTVFQALHCFSNNPKLLFHLNSGKTVTKELENFPGLEDAKYHMRFFMLIKKIERYFGFKFSGVTMSAITIEDVDLVRQLDLLIDHGYFAIKQEEGIDLLDLPADPEFEKAIRQEVPPNCQLYLERPFLENPTLFGKEIPLGNQQVILREPKLVSYDPKNRTARLIPSDHIIVYRYEKFGFQASNGTVTVWNSPKSKINRHS